MRKIVAHMMIAAMAALAASCRSAPAGSAAGALTASAAVQQFLAAAQASNVTAMSQLFGTASGPITTRESANDVEKRMRALQCYLTHDSARLVDDLPGTGATRNVTVELTSRTLTRRTVFTTVPGPRQRWFVSAFDIQRLTDLCRPG